MNDTQWHSLIFNFSHIPHLLCALQQIPLSNNYKGKGQVARGEMEWGTGYWGVGMARLSYGPDFIYEAYTRDGSQAGRPTCCSCPGNIQQWSKGIHRHQQNLSIFLPPPLSFLPLPPSQTLFLSSISSFHSLPLLNKTWPPARCWCHGCHSDRSRIATGLCRKGEVRGKGNYGSLR